MRQALHRILASKIDEPLRLNLLRKQRLTPEKLHETDIVCGLGFHFAARCAAYLDGRQRDDRLDRAAAIQPTGIAKVSRQVEAGDLTTAIRKEAVATGPALQNLVEVIRPLSAAGEMLVMAQSERRARQAFCPC